MMVLANEYFKNHQDCYIIFFDNEKTCQHQKLTILSQQVKLAG